MNFPASPAVGSAVPPSSPPTSRAARYDYHFTGFALRRLDGAWWRRSYTGLYFPVASLRMR